SHSAALIVDGVECSSETVSLLLCHGQAVLRLMHRCTFECLAATPPDGPRAGRTLAASDRMTVSMGPARRHARAAACLRMRCALPVIALRLVDKMTEFWVSQPKHYCKACNVWMDKTSWTIRTHEQASKHKHNIEMMLRKSRKEK